MLGKVDKLLSEIARVCSGNTPSLQEQVQLFATAQFEGKNIMNHYHYPYECRYNGDTKQDPQNQRSKAPVVRV